MHALAAIDLATIVVADAFDVDLVADPIVVAGCGAAPTKAHKQYIRPRNSNHFGTT